MALSDEITRRRQEIHSDGYSMSVGELISMYEHGELELHPQFQRFFRWTDVQKSRLIESLLLGIPVPSIVVSQRPDGVWDVIDGFQRLSTIFELVGILGDENGQAKASLQLTATEYLPSLEGRTWNGDDANGIGRDHQWLIRRSKIEVKIIIERSEASRHELFRRLNMGGSQLSDQEIRNAMIIMENPSFYDWIVALAGDPHFQSCIALPDRLLAEQYHLELVVRFLTLGRIRDSEVRAIDDLDSFLDRAIVRLAHDEAFDRVREGQIFKEIMRMLDETLGSDAFRRFDTLTERHLGGFLIVAFEALAIGMGAVMRDGMRAIDRTSMTKAVRSFWSDGDFLDSVGTGLRGATRMRNVIPYARARLQQCLCVTRTS